MVFWLPYFFSKLVFISYDVYINCLCIGLKHKCTVSLQQSYFYFLNFIRFLFSSFLLIFLPSFSPSLPPLFHLIFFLPSHPPPPVYISLLYTSLTISHSWQLCDVVDRLLHKKSGFRSLFLTNLDSAFQLYYVRKKNSHFWKNVCKLTDNILKTEY